MGTAISGCYICISLLDYVSSYKGNDIYESGLELEWDLKEAGEYDEENARLFFELLSSSYGYIHWCAFSFRDPPQSPGTQSAVANLGLMECYQAPVSSSDPRLARPVQSWLHVCVDEHTGSAATQDTRYRPPRLLCIESGILKLVKGYECPKNSDWATLSHCWGPDPEFLTLTPANLSQFELDIPLDSLPPTFRDAVKFCESIKINFIWIDSLCIVQQGEGSREDWSRHVIEMRRVYQNATLNIAADWAASAQEGLFRDRDTTRIERPIVQFQGGPLKGRWQLGYNSELLRLFSKSSLGSRAWVVQERVLSHRMVSFSADQIYWRCNHQPYFKSEQFPEGLDSTVCQPRLYTSLFVEGELRTKFERYKGKDLTREYSFIRFLNDAGQYSGLSLTRPDSDKFAAFAGIAEHYVHFYKEDYIAGSFKSHLPWALAWKVAQPIPFRIPRSTASSYRSPSWSWAAIDHETDASSAHSLFGLGENKPVGEPVELLEVIETCIELADPENQFGPLLHASLKLRAALLECTWKTDTENPGEVILSSQLKGEAISCFDSVEDFHSDQTCTRMMPLRATVTLGQSGIFSIHFLILRRVLESTSPTYIRIGSAINYELEPSVLDICKSLTTEEIELV